MYQWFQSKRHRNFIINGDNLKEMAHKLSLKFKMYDFKASNRWLRRIQERHRITSKSICGEPRMVVTDIISNFKSAFANKLKEYEDKNIFNCDETVLFYQQSQFKL